MKYFFYIIVLLAALPHASKANAYTPCNRAKGVDTVINPYFELMRLMSHFSDGSLYTFDTYSVYDYSDSSSNHVIDSVHTTFTVAGDKYQVITDTTEEVQSDLYNVKVDNVDSFIIISKPKPVFPLIVQGDMLDSAFQQYLTRAWVVDSGSLRNILTEFRLSSPYYSYLIAYDSVMDFIAVKYSMRNHIPLTPSGSYTILPPAYDYTNLVMSVYITMPSTWPSGLFDTDKYFTRVGNTYTPKAPYTNYEVINQLSNQ